MTRRSPDDSHPAKPTAIRRTLVIAGLLLAGCDAVESRGKPILRHRALGVMGTSLDIKAIGTDAAVLDRAIEAAIAEMRRIEDMMTSWRPSPLIRLNDAAGQGPQPVPAELARIIDRGLAVGEQTGGAFDITFAGVGKLWKFKDGGGGVPEAAVLKEALAHVGYRRVKVDLQNNTVDLPAGMRIGLGGIAKGYGVDRAMAVLMQHGVKHGVVNAGGDMKILGDEFGERWSVTITHPRHRQRAMAAVRVSNTCIVTSGDYERFFDVGGKRYHHIIDPRTGYPSTGCMSATVLAPNAEHADALATALCVLGPVEGLKLIESLPRIEAIVVGMDGEVRATPALRGSLK